MGKKSPSGNKHLFGTVKVGDKGQIVIPKDARELYGIKPGDVLMIMGDDKGIAILKNDIFLGLIGKYFNDEEDK